MAWQLLWLAWQLLAVGVGIAGTKVGWERRAVAHRAAESTDRGVWSVVWGNGNRHCLGPKYVAQYVAHHSYGPIMVCTRWSIVCVCLFVVYVGVRGVSNAHVSLLLRRSRVVRLLCLQHRHSLVINLWLSTGASTLHCDAIQPRSFVHDHAQLYFHNCCAAMLYSMFRLRCQAFSKESRPDARFGTVL